jgi:GDP-4-dehydro-6-deoxy-D-mannose reductase
MRALITGINGFVGGHLAEYLLSLGNWQLWGLSRSGRISLSQLSADVRLVTADLNDAEQTLAALDAAQPEVLFHLAGQPFVPESFRDPADTLHINVFGMLHLIQAVLRLGIRPRILVIGTNEEYGLVAPEQQPINETMPLQPANPYGVSKAAQGLLALQYWRSHKLDMIVMRPFTHIGPRQSARFVTAAWASQIARIEAGRQPPVLRVGNLQVQRDFTDVRDIVRAYVLAARKGQSGTIYNVGSGRTVALQDILEFFLGQSTTPIDIQVDPALLRPIDVPLVLCNAGQLRDHTGWQPQIALEQTLGDILHDWRSRERNLH